MIRGGIALLLSAWVLAGCGGGAMLPGRSQGPYYAGQAGWTWAMADGGRFALATALAPRPAGNRPLAVYIEGDGRAFATPSLPSGDPTPSTPTALRMALAHGGPAAYVARPCQFTDSSTAQGCHVAYWTTHRYAPEVVDGMNRAVDDLKRRSGARRVVLVGYSGGGAVAALLAARRDDVAGLVTVAANLDLDDWVRRDGLAPLTGSLNPADQASALRGLPQVHFVGRRDGVVAPDVVRSFLVRLNSPATARLVEMDDFDHHCCWVRSWPDLVRRPELGIIGGWN